MEDDIGYMNEEEEEVEDEEIENEKESNTPISKISGLDFQGLYKINQVYANQLSKQVTSESKVILPYNDLKVLNSLIKENHLYLTSLLKYKDYKVEFDELYKISMEILSLLGRIGPSKINIYQKCQKLKFMELKYQSLRISGRDVDYSDADILLGEMEKIHYDKSMKNYITELDIGTLSLNRAFVKFSIYDFYLAKEYALNALSILDKVNPNDPKNRTIKKNDEEKDRYIQRLCQVHEFLAEFYDLQGEYQNALTSYEKCYYLYLGRYGIDHPLVIPLKKKKESYEKRIESMSNARNEQNKEENLISKLKGGRIINSKGKSDTFSFMVPNTEIGEPLLIKIYSLPKYPGETDYFSNYLFLKNLYFDKIKMFFYLGLNEDYQQQNYVLYTDEVLNEILLKITVKDNKYIKFTDPSLYSVFINC